MPDGMGFKAAGVVPEYEQQDMNNAKNDETNKIKTEFITAMTAYQTDPSSAKSALQGIVDMKSPMTVSDLAQSFIDDIPAEKQEEQPSNMDVNPPAELAQYSQGM